MNDDAVQPWTALANAHERLEDARRAVEWAAGIGDEFDRAIAAAELTAAQAEYDRTADHLAALGSLLLLFAIERGGLHTQKILQRLFDTRSIWRKALSAEQAAADVIAELDALRCRLVEVEELIAQMTPGVMEPGLRIAR